MGEARRNWRCFGAPRCTCRISSTVLLARRLRRGDDWQAYTRSRVIFFKQPFAWKAPGIIIEVGFVEMLREGEGLAQGRDVELQGQPEWTDRPRQAVGEIQEDWPADLKNAPRFPGLILPKVKEFVSGLADRGPRLQKRAQVSLDYEFARAKVIGWGDMSTLRSATFARRGSCSRSFSRAPAKPCLPQCAIGCALTAVKKQRSPRRIA